MRCRLLTSLIGAAALLAVPGFGTGIAHADEVPVVRLTANAPGWITVYWQHSAADGVRWYTIQRQDRPHNSPVTDGVIVDAPGQWTDTGLTANTTYTYRVCAVYDYSTACSDWTSARTLAAATPPPPSPPSPPPPSTPSVVNFKVDANTGPFTLSWLLQGTDIKHVTVERDGNVIADYPFALSYTDYVNRPNTPYTWRVCAYTSRGQPYCSNAVTAMHKPLVPVGLQVTLQSDGAHVSWMADASCQSYGADHLELQREVNGRYETVRAREVRREPVSCSGSQKAMKKAEVIGNPSWLLPSAIEATDVATPGGQVVYRYRICVVNAYGGWCSGPGQHLNPAAAPARKKETLPHLPKP